MNFFFFNIIIFFTVVHYSRYLGTPFVQEIWKSPLVGLLSDTYPLAVRALTYYENESPKFKGIKLIIAKNIFNSWTHFKVNWIDVIFFSCNMKSLVTIFAVFCVLIRSIFRKSLLRVLFFFKWIRVITNGINLDKVHKLVNLDEKQKNASYNFRSSCDLQM